MTNKDNASMHPDTASFLNALFRDYDGELPLVLDEVLVKSSDPNFIAQNDGKLRVCAGDGDKVFFLFAAQLDTDRDAWSNCRALPTVVVHRDGVSLFIWAFRIPASVDDPTVIALGQYFEMETLQEPIPLPGTDGWEMPHHDMEGGYTPETLAEFYLEAVGAPPAKVSTQQMYGEAVCVTPYNESDYNGRMITVSIGPNSCAKNWKPQKLPLTNLIHQYTMHKIGKKDGVAVVLGDMVPGQRLKKSIKTCEAIGLDIDTGTPSAVVDKALAKLGCLAIRATTHSHGKRSSEISKDAILRFDRDAPEIDDELIKKFLLEKQQWDKSIVETIKFVEEDQTDKGIVCRISHMEMPKHRIIVPLDQPFVVAKEGRTQQEAMAKWSKVPAALAAKLGVPEDKSCSDLSRLFFLSRHDNDRPYEISIFGGPLLSLSSLQLDNQFDAVAAAFAKGGSKSVTAEGKALGKWWKMYAHGTQIVDIIESYAPDKRRSKASNGYNIECPFDEDHGNAGDSLDQACFAVNAGDGSYEFFHISCRHQSCQDKSRLDMLGKMLKDGWFDKSAITDPQFNIAEIDVSEQPTANSPPETEQDVQAFIQGVQKTDSQAVRLAVAMIAKFDDPVVRGVLATQLKSVGPLTRKEIMDAANNLRRMADTPEQGKRDNRGRIVVASTVDHDADESIEQIRVAIRSANEGAGANPEAYPRIVCIWDQPHELRRIGGRVEYSKLTLSRFRSILREYVSFTVLDMNGVRGPTELPPKDICEVVFSELYDYVPQAPEIIRTPVFSENGTLLDEDGWHIGPPGKNALNVFVDLGGLEVPPISPVPCAGEVAEAVAVFDDLYIDFPFWDVAPDGSGSSTASRANAFAMLTTPFARRLFTGCTPLFLIDKAEPGTGGTLLAQATAMVFDGKAAYSTRYTANEEEMQKRLTAALRSNSGQLLFDQVKVFDSQVLIEALTMEMLSGRILGASDIFVRVNNFVWQATGNNIRIVADMVRRICRMRLEAKTPFVTKRVFKHDLQTWIPENRAKLIWAVLTLIQSWLANDKPRFTARKLPSFDEWVAVVGGIIQNAGVEGFLDNPQQASPESDEGALGELAEILFRKYGCNYIKGGEVINYVTNLDNELISEKDAAGRKRQILEVLGTLNGRAFIFGDHSVTARLMVGAEGRVFGFGVTQP